MRTGNSAQPWLRVAALALVALLDACSGGAVQAGSASPGTSLPSLPAPNSLRSAAFADADRFKAGAAFSAALPNAGVASAGNALRFSPDWDPGAGQRSPAYAVYAWTLPAYAGAPAVGLDWAAAPASGLMVWLGLADFQTNRWDWQKLDGAAAGGSLAPLGSYRKGDGSIFAAVLVLGKSSLPQPLLNRVFVGVSDTVVPGDQQFSVDLAAPGTPISPLVYGVNEVNAASKAAKPTLVRYGGNRWTAYNWENNASNAGTDWFNQNDDTLSSSTAAGAAVKSSVQAAFAAGAATLVTVPIQGYCAADINPGGDVNLTPDYIHVRFKQNKPAKGSAFSLTPNTSDAFVYQDEFLNWLNSTFPGKLSANPAPIMLSLDNEPDLWATTHLRIQTAKVGYDELIDKSIANMLALRAVVPQAQFFGPVSYGYNGYINLQSAPDSAAHGEFLNYYLDRMKQAEADHGQRLLNVLDLHWYPEATGGGIRITENDSSPAVVAARLQAPRSLWDSTYKEDSWIANDYLNAPIDLLPWLKDKIAAHYSGTKLAFTEYNYGAGGDISGGLAEADALGVFGREGVYCACMWPLDSDNSFIYGALRLYRNYDGSGGRFGDLAQPLDWSDYAGYSAYAAKYSADSSHISVLLLNKQTTAKLGEVILNGGAAAYTAAAVYTLAAAGGANPVHGADISLPAGGSFNVSLPGRSATLLILK